MRIFKKKNADQNRLEKLENTIKALENNVINLNGESYAQTVEIQKLRGQLPELVSEYVHSLARSESIYAATTYRGHEFITKLVEDETRALRHKKSELEQAIKECDKALTKIKEKK